MASFGGKKSRTQQTSSSRARSFVDPRQQQFLQFLRSQGAGIAGQQLGPGGPGDVGRNLGQQLSGAGQDLLGQLQAGGAGQLSSQQLQEQAAQQAIAGQGAGQDFLTQRLSGGNPFLNQQIQALGADIGQQFREQILPGIRGNAVTVGGLGGGRGQIAEGLAAQRSQQTFGSLSAGLRQQDLAQQQQAATSLAQLQQQGQLGGGALAGQSAAQQGQFAQAGLGQLGGLFNLGLAPFGAQFQPLQSLQGLVGQPTVLSQQQQQGQGTSSSSGFNLGFGSLFTG